MRKEQRNLRGLSARIGILSVFLGIVACSFAQQFPTNSISQAVAVRITSRLRVGLREDDLSSALDEPNGLKSGGRVGDSFGWTHFYYLSNGCFLDLYFEPGEFRSDGKWQGGILKEASIQSNGVKIVSITLTNKP